jgi:hypothetical protein
LGRKSNSRKITNKNHQKPLSLKNSFPEYIELESERLQRCISSTPAKRLAWLEEALELAYRTGAIRSKIPKKPVP